MTRDTPLHTWLEPDITGTFRRETARALPIVGAGLAVLYGVYLAASLLATARGLNPAPWQAVRFGLSAAAVAAVGAASRPRRDRRESHVHALAGVMCLVPLVNSAWQLIGSGDARESVNLLLVVSGLGALLLTARWFVLTLGCAWAGWLCAALPAGGGFSVFGFALFAASLLATVSFVTRRRTLVRLERARAEAQRAALVDALTGVYNRRGMEVLAPALLRRAQSGGDLGEVTVVAVDIDDMKGINDVHGHAAGDAAVQGAAEVLRRSTRLHDVVARTGGDEFIALLDAPAGAGVQQRILDNLATRVARGGEPFHLELSVGTVTLPATVGLADLLGAADAAMYQIKQRRRAARGGRPRPGAAAPGAVVVAG
ncbi:GGDEF domain-containing protein [Kineococcus rhizosphaerae]|uniref:Diguanylate cyclase (GGDEF)-like protein n=1 Tax=Kineococcus rhizosphaerae TaxID=559628 RepID=A0A2T0RBU8_9ACTN|nr:GGDEF domain-containing protein [Kineococcus rhizosphaerae]PRY18617.1 diguanylate cyclase (GGDEF)-like protein [Kineococcus rhizosphaerae]